MIPSLQQAIADLKEERDRIDSAIRVLEDLTNGSLPTSKREHRPAKVGKTTKRAPRGLLKKLIHEALAKAKTPLKPVELTDAVIAAGYPHTTKQILYTAIFTAVKKDPQVKKSSEGLLTLATSSERKKPAKKPAAKKTKPASKKKPAKKKTTKKARKAKSAPKRAER